MGKARRRMPPRDGRREERDRERKRHTLSMFHANRKTELFHHCHPGVKSVGQMVNGR